MDLDGKPIDEAQKDNNLGAVSKIVNNTILTGDEAKNDTNLGNFKGKFTSYLRPSRFWFWNILFYSQESNQSFYTN